MSNSTIGSEFGTFNYVECPGNNYITKISGTEQDYIRSIQIECSDGKVFDSVGTVMGNSYTLEDPKGFIKVDGDGHKLGASNSQIKDGSLGKVTRLTLYSDKPHTINPTWTAPGLPGKTCPEGSYLNKAYIWSNEGSGGISTLGITGVDFDCKDIPAAEKNKIMASYEQAEDTTVPTVEDETTVDTPDPIVRDDTVADVPDPVVPEDTTMADILEYKAKRAAEDTNYTLYIVIAFILLVIIAVFIAFNTSGAPPQYAPMYAQPQYLPPQYQTQ